MANPVRPEGSATSTPSSPADGKVPPHLLSRDYEDYLDWLENQRNSRNRRSRRHAWLGAISGAAALIFSLPGILMRKR